MGLRYRKSVNIGPLRINFSRSGVGYSFGGKLLRVTKKAKGGYRATTTMPGTGVSYSKELSGGEVVDMGKDLAKFVAGGIAVVMLLIGGLVGCVAQDDDPTADEQDTMRQVEQVTDTVQSDSSDVATGATQGVSAGSDDSTDGVTPVDPNPADVTPIAPAVAPETDPEVKADAAPQAEEKKVYRTKSGKRYHYDDNCNGGTYYEVTLDKALAAGLTPCQKCAGG